MNNTFFKNAVYIDNELLYGVGCYTGFGSLHASFKKRNPKASEVLYSRLVMIIDHLDMPEEEYVNFFINRSNQDKNSYRLYKTKNGFRTIRTNKIENFNIARKKISELIPDELYFQFLYIYSDNEFFKARLTPKYENLLKVLSYQNNTYEEVGDIISRLNKQSFSLIVDSIKNSQYEERFAVCKFIHHTGNQFVHDNIKEMIDFHDNKTKAFSNLELA